MMVCGQCTLPPQPCACACATRMSSCVSQTFSPGRRGRSSMTRPGGVVEVRRRDASQRLQCGRTVERVNRHGRQARQRGRSIACNAGDLPAPKAEQMGGQIATDDAGVANNEGVLGVGPGGYRWISRGCQSVWARLGWLRRANCGQRSMGAAVEDAHLVDGDCVEQNAAALKRDGFAAFWRLRNHAFDGRLRMAAAMSGDFDTAHQAGLRRMALCRDLNDALGPMIALNRMAELTRVPGLPGSDLQGHQQVLAGLVRRDAPADGQTAWQEGVALDAAAALALLQGLCSEASSPRKRPCCNALGAVGDERLISATDRQLRTD